MQQAALWGAWHNLDSYDLSATYLLTTSFKSHFLSISRSLPAIFQLESL